MDDKTGWQLAKLNLKLGERSCFWWLGRISLGLLAFVVAANLAGFVYQRSASARDLQRYPPPGEIIDVRGTRMHLHCMGEGSPTVVLEAGAGSSSIDWSLVQPEVAEHTRVCAYDRPGFGWSDPVSGPQSRDQVAMNLHDLLEAGGISGPYVLAGHSLGGEYVRAFASLYPEETAGLVLVDSSHESHNARIPAEFQRFERLQLNSLILCRYLAPFGWVRAFRIMDALYADVQVPDGIRDAAFASLYRTPFCKAAYDEMEMVYDTRAAGTAGPPDLGDMPLIVLVAGLDPETVYDDLPPAINSIVERDVFLRSYAIMDEMKRELVSLSSQGKFVPANESHHHIHWDQPELVVDAIREVCEAAGGSVVTITFS